ncbi:hypothetical protein LS482_14260 [Sinomicrobium kalidii]|uniref:hypothetical protein n=1 Tax=Sinomicrobium kalidii TaxID=2900738 RepID=UPI001E31517A|nr:hypothetical protein [Sinomicrobium kalidii]UGU14854.1 hypothetical protein LS482_14260 [Sinomicrobium kalidii]
MNYSRPRFEEYTTIAEFLIATLERDQKELASRFSKYSPQYIARFRRLNEKVKELENPGGITQNMKQATTDLYEKAEELRDELSFLSAYYRSAELQAPNMVELKRNLNTKNIEGAMHLLTALKDHVAKNRKALIGQGMDENMADMLVKYRDSMNNLNQKQHRILSQRKELTRKNREQYDALFDYIKTVIYDGKIMYKNDPKAQDYTLTSLIKQLRAPERHLQDGETEDDMPDIPGAVD